MLTLEEKLKNLPDKPGVYIMKDRYNEIIYVGKAINLKNRVRQYFQASRNQHPKVAAMVERIENFEYIITDSELEALILECNLIKKHRPKYNVLLKDDKSYPYIKVTVNEEFPRLMVVREIKKDGARYFGPYTDIGAVNRTIEIMQSIFKIRNCNKNISKIKGRERPCLNYHIEKCMAPCRGNISSGEYKDIIKSICMVLDGKQEELIKSLESKMHTASENLDFEKAAEIRDSIESVKKMGEKQKAITSALADQDVIAFAKESGEACVQIFFIRGGKLVGREHFFLDNAEYEEAGEIVGGFIKQFYNGEVFVPREIVLQDEVDEINIIERWLSDKRGGRVKLVVPRRGEKHKLIELVSKNAEDTLKLIIEKHKHDEEKTKGACREIAQYLGIDKVFFRIEAYDISNLQGVENVGSMIVFENGKPKNRDYRRFKIKGFEGANDYDSMREILMRRFSHGTKECEELSAAGKDINTGRFSIFPELIMIDGGLGQVNVALDVIKSFELEIPVCGMVKDDKHRTRGLIYNNAEIGLPINSNAFRLITSIQDEAHRFAISYHRSLREKTVVKSQLDDIPGIGPARRKALLKAFGSLKNIKSATVEELNNVDGMNIKAAEEVYNFYNK